MNVTLFCHMCNRKITVELDDVFPTDAVDEARRRVRVDPGWSTDVKEVFVNPAASTDSMLSTQDMCPECSRKKGS